MNIFNMQVNEIALLGKEIEMNLTIGSGLVSTSEVVRLYNGICLHLLGSSTCVMDNWELTCYEPTCMQIAMIRGLI